MIVDKLSTKTANRALPTLPQLNEQHLRQSEELRYILNSRLKTRGLDGKIVVKTDVSIPDIARAVMAFGVLFRHDRLALGADTGSLPEPQNRFDDMSDEELVEELKRVRARNIIQ
ncbi:MAG TPA: hypothetical protein VK578_03305 [Edaphobacter sp.]|nr:hypothetical protein [Edaphobacter sp.]